jgi:hypothetical protein
LKEVMRRRNSTMDSPPGSFDGVEYLHGLLAGKGDLFPSATLPSLEFT